MLRRVGDGFTLPIKQHSCFVCWRHTANGTETRWRGIPYENIALYTTNHLAVRVC